MAIFNSYVSHYQRVFIGILMGSESERIFMGIEAAKLRIILWDFKWDFVGFDEHLMGSNGI